MSCESIDTLLPRFPPRIPHPLLPCPRVGKFASTFSHRFWFYVHEYLLVLFSDRVYTRLCGIPHEPGVHPLPFGLILKRTHRVREDEGLAMNLARAMGIPAPRFISFGTHPDHPLSSILMTRIHGVLLQNVPIESRNLDALRSDLSQILTYMRSYASPYEKAICNIVGRPVRGPFLPPTIPRLADEAAFQDILRRYGQFGAPRAEDADLVPHAEAMFALPEHAIVFTHGDLADHNIFVTLDGHVAGIIDWETAGWLPEYWEISVMAFLPRRPWGAFLNKDLTQGTYAEECTGHTSLFTLISDSLSIC